LFLVDVERRDYLEVIDTLPRTWNRFALLFLRNRILYHCDKCHFSSGAARYFFQLSVSQIPQGSS
jgi:hypothetical protein